MTDANSLDERPARPTPMAADQAQRPNRSRQAPAGRQLARRLYEEAPVGLLALDASGTVLEANPQAAALLGVKQPTLRQQPLAAFVAPDDRPVVPQALRQATACPDQRAPAVTLRLLRRTVHGGAQLFWGRLDVTAVTPARPRTAGPAFWVALSETSAPTPTAATPEEQSLAALFDLLPVGLAVLNEQRDVVFANATFKRLLALPDDRLAAQAYRQRRYLRTDGTLMPSSEFASVRAHREHRPVHDVETGVIMEDGSTLWTSVSATPIPPDSRRPHWDQLVIVQDISGRQRVQEALRAREREYRALLAAAQRRAQERDLLDQVRMTLSHELHLPTVFRRVVEAIARIFGYSQVSIYILKGQNLILQHQVGYGAPINVIPVSIGVSGRVVRSGWPCLIEDVRSDPDFLAAMPGIVGEVCVPLFDDERVIGVLNIESDIPGALTTADLELMMALSESVSLAIQRAALYTQMSESEERFRTLVEELQVGLLLVDRNAAIVMCNRKGLDLLGLSRDQVVGKTAFDPAWDVMHEDGSPFAAAAFPIPEAIASRQAVRNVLMGVRRPETQDLIWLLVSASPQLDAGGQVRQVICTFLDVSERLQTERAIRREKDFNQAVIDSLPGLYCLLDEEGRLLHWNKNLETVSGYTAAEMAHMHLTDFFQEPDRALSLLRLRDGLARGRAAGEGIMVAKDQTRTPYFFTGRRVVFSDQVRIIGMGFDMSERRQAELRAFELALERERTSLLNAFVQNASHEFRTPLAIIRTSLYLMERSTDPDKRRQKVRQIEQQVSGITRLVDLLAEITFLQSGAPLAQQPVDCNALVSETAEQRRQTAAAAGVALRLALAPALPALMGDGERLRLALAELLDNAIRFSPAGSVVEVRSAAVTEGIRLEVQDAGPGIAPEMQQRIFERFYRQDASHSTPGFGLGLPIARLIVERHGGLLEVESHVRQGSLFRMTLPVKMPGISGVPGA